MECQAGHKIGTTQSLPSFDKNTDKMGRTFIDFFSVPKQSFTKTRLSVNMFQLKVKPPLCNNNITHQPAKKSQLQNISKLRSDKKKNQNLLLNIVDEDQQNFFRNKEFLPTLERIQRNQELTISRGEDFYKQQMQKSMTDRILGKNKKIRSEYKPQIQPQSSQKCQIQTLPDNISLLPSVSAMRSAQRQVQIEQMQKKSYFINNLSLASNINNNLGSSYYGSSILNQNSQISNKNSSNPKKPQIFNDLSEQIHAWQNFISQQNSLIKLKKTQIVTEQLKLANKIKLTPRVPDSLITFQIPIINPEQITNKLKKNLKITLIKRKKEEKQPKDDSNLGRWDDLPEDINEDYSYF